MAAGPSGFREAVLACIEAMEALCDRMLPAFAVALGMLEGHFARFFAAYHLAPAALPAAGLG